MAQPSTRRAILAGIASAPLIGAPVLAGDDPANAALRRWLDQVAIIDGPAIPREGNIDALMVPLMSRLDEIERDVHALPPSANAAAVIALLELSYSIMSPMDDTVADMLAFHDKRLLPGILMALRPSLSGLVADMVGDLLDRQAEPYGASRFGRAARGEA